MSDKGSRVPLRLLAILIALCLAGCQTVPATGGFTPEQRAMLQQQGFVETTDGWELSMADRLLFDSDSAVIQTDMAMSLDRLASNLGRVGIRSARVDGHTDSTGSAAYNSRLSAGRARVVGDRLSAHGFAVRVQGRGEAQPIADNRTQDGRQLNRRVVIIVSPE